MPMKARYIEEIGTAYVFQVNWKDEAVQCTHNGTYHYGQTELRREMGPYNKNIGEGFSWIREGDPLYPTACKYCGLAVPPTMGPVTVAPDATPGPLVKKVDSCFITQRLYNTESGRPEPGDIYFRQLNCKEWGCGYGWKNCNGEHLHTVLPTGEPWDVDSRASNCTLQGDGAHRCWVRHGDPRKGEPVHVDKNGLTCAAGAGSIATPRWHGFLHSGLWVP